MSAEKASGRRKRTSVAEQYQPHELGDILAHVAPDQGESGGVAAPETVSPAQPQPAPVSATEATTLRRGRPRKHAAVDGAKAPVNVRLPLSMLNVLEDLHERTATPYITILLRAVAATVDELPQLIAQDTARRKQLQAGSRESDPHGLFVYSDVQGARAVYDEPTETRIWRTYQANVNSLNGLVATTGATDRNQLLLVALRAYLKIGAH